MDRKNYDNRTIGIFDTIGSYFIDLFYNDQYLRARDIVKQGRINSITDAYRTIIINYMNGITHRNDLYMIAVKKLHEFYQKMGGFGIVVFSDFEDKILSQFIPPEYYRDFNERQKDNTLRKIIIKTVQELGEMILETEILTRIIDDHKNATNVTFLQDRVLEILIMQREDYYVGFTKEISRRNDSGKINKELIDKLKQAFVNEKKQRCELEIDKERAINMITQLTNRITQLENEVKQLRATALDSTSRKKSKSGSDINFKADLKADLKDDLKADSKSRDKLKNKAGSNTTPKAVSNPAPASPLKVQDSAADIAITDSDSDIDDEQLHQRQREALMRNRAKHLDHARPDVASNGRDNTNIMDLCADEPW